MISSTAVLSLAESGVCRLCCVTPSAAVGTLCLPIGSYLVTEFTYNCAAPTPSQRSERYDEKFQVEGSVAAQRPLRCVFLYDKARILAQRSA